MSSSPAREGHLNCCLGQRSPAFQRKNIGLLDKLTPSDCATSDPGSSSVTLFRAARGLAPPSCTPTTAQSTATVCQRTAGRARQTHQRRVGAND